MRIITVLLTFMWMFVSTNAVTIMVPKAPPAIPIIKAVHEIEDFDIKYYTSVNTEVVPKIVKGEEYVYLLPTNLAAKLSSKGNDIRLLSVLSGGLLSIVGTEELGDIRDLNGKKVYIGAQGSSPDVISRYIFSKNNVRPKIVYRSSNEIFKLAVSKKIDLAVLPEPLASMALQKNSSLKRLFILKDEWEKINGEDYIPQVGLFVDKTFLEKEKNEIKKFLHELKVAVAWANGNVYDAAKLGIEEMDLNFKPDELILSIPYMNLTYIDAGSSKAGMIKYLESLIEMNENILDELPQGEFYESKID